jgi:hypothetical protein
MNGRIKKTLFLIVFINVNLLVFANGSQDRYQQSFGAIQLKIVNLTGNTIYFYFNRLYFPTEIKSNEEYITQNTLVSHQHLPLDNGIPSFIGIQYFNDKKIIIYRFRYRISERIFLKNNQYIVIVKDSDIDFIEGNIDDTHDYNNESLYQRFPNLDWDLERLGQHLIEFKIENNSGSRRVVWIYTILKDLVTLVIEDEKIENINIDYRLLQLGGMRLQVVDNGYTVDSINIRYLPSNSPEGEIIPSIIEINLNKYGHGIFYKDYVSWWNIIRNKPYQNFYEINNR